MKTILSRHISGISKIIFGFLLMITVSSCRQEDDFLNSGFEDESDVIRVSATILPVGQTRNPYWSEDVETLTTGTFYLTYPRNGNETSTNAIYKTATVNFDASTDDKAIGFAYFTNNDGEYRDLKWKHIWNEGNTPRTFYFHNLNPDYYTETYTETSTSSHLRTQYYQKVSFKETSPFYTIRPLDKINGTNDLITGSVEADNTVKGLEFTLNHRLSLLKLNIEVYASESDNWTVDLSNARVILSNLYNRLSSFSISYPTTYSSSSSSTYSAGYVTNRKDFALKDNGIEELDWDEIEYGSYLAEDGVTYSKNVYRSKEFVIPPQNLVKGYTPKFTVRVPKKDVTGIITDVGDSIDYTGSLPESMFNVEDGVLASAPILTAFTSGYQLTVTASINSPETELYFSPVQVESWVSKSTFTVNTNQGGIYTLNDFQNMVRAYREGNRATLERYGYMTSDGSFILQFWSNIEIPKEVLPGIPLQNCMANDETDPIYFMFAFNGNVIKVNDGLNLTELEDSEGQIELYNIVTGENLEYTGVNSIEVMKDVIEILKGEKPTPQFYRLQQYAIFNNVDNMLIIDITGSFDIDIEDIFQQLPLKSENYDVFAEVRDEVQVNVVFSEEDDVKFTYANYVDPSVFQRIAFGSPNVGVYSREDFELLKQCYNEFYKYFNDILNIFGTQASSGTSWTINFRSSFTVNGRDFFYSMVPNETEMRPAYSLSTSSCTVTIEDDLIPCSSSNASQLGAMLKGGGSAGDYDNDHMKSVVSYYNNSNYNTRNCWLWTQGRFDFDKERWVIPLAYKSHPTFILWCYWDTIFGKMIPDPEGGVYDFEFDFKDINNGYFQMRNPPLEEDDPRVSKGTLSGGTTYLYFRLYPAQDGEEALRQICLGTYWEWMEEKENAD